MLRPTRQVSLAPGTTNPPSVGAGYRRSKLKGIYIIPPRTRPPTRFAAGMAHGPQNIVMVVTLKSTFSEWSAEYAKWASSRATFSNEAASKVVKVDDSHVAIFMYDVNHDKMVSEGVVRRVLVDSARLAGFCSAPAVRVVRGARCRAGHVSAHHR